MPRPKKALPKVKAKPKKELRDPRIEEVYEQEVTFMCPIRGKVTQKVKIKRFKPADQQVERSILQSSEWTDKLEEKDDGLSIYSDGEDLGLEGGDAE